MVRVLIIDDSATVRRRLAILFGVASDFQVVGQAANATDVLLLIERHHPDVVCLDVFLEETDAAQVTRVIRTRSNVPIILVSEASRAAPEVFEALAAGALDLVPKPRLGDVEGVNRFLKAVRRICLAPRAREEIPRAGIRSPRTETRLVVVGASTGAPGPLRALLAELPSDFHSPILVAQHLLPGFEDDFARWLGASTALEVRVAQHGECITRGSVLLIPSGTDGRLLRGSRVEVRSAAVHGYHPSVDVLFKSAAEQLGAGVVAVVLSGIGSEGVEGARAVADAGGTVLIQDPGSCAVVGMPWAVLHAGIPAVAGSPASLARELLRPGSRHVSS